MSPKESFAEFQRVLRQKAELVAQQAMVDAELEIARARLYCGIEDEVGGDGGYQVTITHDKAAAEVARSTKSIIRWVKSGDLKALPKREDERKYQIPITEWTRFKKNRGL